MPAPEVGGDNTALLLFLVFLLNSPVFFAASPAFLEALLYSLGMCFCSGFLWCFLLLPHKSLKFSLILWCSSYSPHLPCLLYRLWCTLFLVMPTKFH